MWRTYVPVILALWRILHSIRRLEPFTITFNDEDLRKWISCVVGSADFLHEFDKLYAEINKNNTKALNKKNMNNLLKVRHLGVTFPLVFRVQKIALMRKTNSFFDGMGFVHTGNNIKWFGNGLHKKRVLVSIEGPQLPLCLGLGKGLAGAGESEGEGSEILIAIFVVAAIFVVKVRILPQSERKGRYRCESWVEMERKSWYSTNKWRVVLGDLLWEAAHPRTHNIPRYVAEAKTKILIPNLMLCDCGVPKDTIYKAENGCSPLSFGEVCWTSWENFLQKLGQWEINIQWLKLLVCTLWLNL